MILPAPHAFAPESEAFQFMPGMYSSITINGYSTDTCFESSNATVLPSISTGLTENSPFVFPLPKTRNTPSVPPSSSRRRTMETLYSRAIPTPPPSKACPQSSRTHTYHGRSLFLVGIRLALSQRISLSSSSSYPTATTGTSGLSGKQDDGFILCWEDGPLLWPTPTRMMALAAYAFVLQAVIQHIGTASCQRRSSTPPYVPSFLPRSSNRRFVEKSTSVITLQKEDSSKQAGEAESITVASGGQTISNIYRVRPG